MMERPGIIAGSARSGTTWVLDALAKTNNLRPIFEPLHPQAVRAAAPYAGRYLSAKEDAAELEKFLDRVFSGAFHSIWTDYRIRPRLLKPTRQRFSSLGNLYALYTEWRAVTRRYIKLRPGVRGCRVLIKMIRANLMLDWLREKYDARIVFVVRHPGAVVESKIRIGGVSWDPAPLVNHYRSADVLGECENRYRALLAEDLSPVEAHTLVWCIENQLPLEQASENRYLSIFYESLVRNGEQEWMRIKEALALEVSPYGAAIVDLPSQQAALLRSKGNGGRGAQWYDRVSAKDLHAIEGILQATGVSCYSAFDPLPRLPGTEMC